jgi:hypothetical protein
MVVGESEAGDSVRFLARGEVAGRVDLEASADGPGLLGGRGTEWGSQKRPRRSCPPKKWNPPPQGWSTSSNGRQERPSSLILPRALTSRHAVTAPRSSLSPLFSRK